MADRHPVTFPVVIDTLGALFDHGHIMQGWCRPCQRGFDVDLSALVDRLGREWVFIGRKVPVTCPRCDSAETETRIGRPPGVED